MKIEVAQQAGHCFGVKAAIQKAFETATQARVPVYTLGPIIHNPQVVEQLEKAGVKAVKNLSEIGEGVIIVRSHGVSPQTLLEAKRRGLTVIDATCPFVQRVQRLALELLHDNYNLVLVGDPSHPEVEGIMGTVEGKAVVVASARQALELPVRRRYGVVSQTTQSLENLQQVTSALLTRTHTLKIFNTICNATTHLQKETRALAKRVDLMLVVGGRNSANTNRLAEICREAGVPTWHIETAQEIEAAWLQGVGTVGVTAGTSTPDWMIQEIVEALVAHGGRL